MGKKEALSKDQIQHFFYTGTMHLFAVSGLHVGVIGAFFFFLGRLLCLPKLLRLMLTGSGVWLYAAVVGFGPSTLRATLMITFVLLAQLFSRPVSGQNVFFNTVGLTHFVRRRTTVVAIRRSATTFFFPESHRHRFLLRQCHKQSVFDALLGFVQPVGVYRQFIPYPVRKLYRHSRYGFLGNFSPLSAVADVNGTIIPTLP